MKTNSTLLAALLAAIPVSTNALIWVPYTDIYSAKEYAVTDLAYTWHDAEAFALTEGAHLVSINDAAENAWIVATFGGGELFWIGLTDEASEGTFVWTSGDPFTYSNWNGGEPNDLTEEEWTHINWTVAGGWNDFESGTDYVNPAQGNISYQNDSFPQRAILERPVRPVPDTASSAALLGLAAVGLATFRRIIR
ncbi:MAG: hypothetical protein L0Z50_14275 [Verrucomicrobiales bacterium]|nr:hypothetical protein [Verrucomicrobiales bacterium]